MLKVTRQDLESAWRWREALGCFKRSKTFRVFHGPGEGAGGLEFFAFDCFNDCFWVTEWEAKQNSNRELIRTGIIEFLRSKGAQSIVGLTRPEKGVAPVSEVWWGTMPEQRFQVQENSLHFWIQFDQTRHPGLFLDHEPLRKWLVQNMAGLEVLNTFAYTGSLSVAAAAGGATSVTTLDLSQPVIQWAKENMILNGFQGEDYRFIAGDFFEWMPRLRREKQLYDCIILDPPSFSHGKKGNFSTAKDLEKLHKVAIDLLKGNGILITSINSGNISWKKYETDLLHAFHASHARFLVIEQIDLPETFPTGFAKSEDRYLKGWILKRLS